MSFPPEFIHRAVVNQAYQISIHADDERLADGLKIDELESTLTNCEIIGQYPEDARDESCLVLGFWVRNQSLSLAEETAQASGLDHGLHPVHAQMERPLHEKSVEIGDLNEISIR
jgi:hypothetical protein